MLNKQWMLVKCKVKENAHIAGLRERLKAALVHLYNVLDPLDRRLYALRWACPF